MRHTHSLILRSGNRKTENIRVRLPIYHTMASSKEVHNCWRILRKASRNAYIDVASRWKTTYRWNNNFISVLIRVNMCKALNSRKIKTNKKHPSSEQWYPMKVRMGEKERDTVFWRSFTWQHPTAHRKRKAKLLPLLRSIATDWLSWIQIEVNFSFFVWCRMCSQERWASDACCAHNGGFYSLSSHIRSSTNTNCIRTHHCF